MRSMPTPTLAKPRRLDRRYWTAYFDALATGPPLSKPHTVRRRAGEVARNCPYPDVTAQGLAKVKAALEALRLLTPS